MKKIPSNGEKPRGDFVFDPNFKSKFDLLADSIKQMFEEYPWMADLEMPKKRRHHHGWILDEDDEKRILRRHGFGRGYGDNGVFDE